VLIGLRFKTHAIDERIHLVPIAEVGFGDVTMVAGNLDGHYVFKTDSKYAPYAGVGFTVNWFDTDYGSNTEVGGSIIGGIQLTPKFFFETKIGLGDVPDWKFVLGWGM
jgi:opacity protein-like surface antigen